MPAQAASSALAGAAAANADAEAALRAFEPNALGVFGRGGDGGAWRARVRAQECFGAAAAAKAAALAAKEAVLVERQARSAPGFLTEQRQGTPGVGPQATTTNRPCRSGEVLVICADSIGTGVCSASAQQAVGNLQDVVIR